MISILTDIQKKANKILLFTTLVGTMTACDSVLDFDEGDCSIEYGVTFKYDYNIKNVDAFAQEVKNIIRKSKFPPNPERSVQFSGKRTKRSVQKKGCAQHL